MVTTNGIEITGGTTGGSSLVAIYTYGCKVWPDAESWNGPWPGPEIHKGDFYIEWTPSDWPVNYSSPYVSVFSIGGSNYYFEDYNGYFDDFYDNVITSRAFESVFRATSIGPGEPTVSLETTARKVESSGFKDCYDLRRADLSQCSYIGFRGFFDCINLSRVSIPKCTWIDEQAFYRNYLTTISLPNVTYIGTSAFASCFHLGYVYIGPYCSMIGSSAFHSVGVSLSGYTDYVLAYRGPGTVAISGSLGNLGSLTVPAWKESLYSYMVSQEWQHFNPMIYIEWGSGSSKSYYERFGYEGIDSSGIPWSSLGGKPSVFETDALYIAGYVFEQTNVYSVSLSQIRTLRDRAFKGCTSLLYMYAPHLAVIGGEALAATTLYEIAAPLISIGNRAFNGATIATLRLLPPEDNFYRSSVCYLGFSVFEDARYLSKIYVPSSMYDKYISAERWSEYSNIITSY